MTSHIALTSYISVHYLILTCSSHPCASHYLAWNTVETALTSLLESTWLSLPLKEHITSCLKHSVAPTILRGFKSSLYSAWSCQLCLLSLLISFPVPSAPPTVSSQTGQAGFHHRKFLHTSLMPRRWLIFVPSLHPANSDSASRCGVLVFWWGIFRTQGPRTYALIASFTCSREQLPQLSFYLFPQ